MITANTLWRHRHSKDIDLYVVSIDSIDSLGVDIRVRYWNRNYNCFAHPAIEPVRIKLEDLGKWRMVNGT
jgi:hypothetical protein